MFLARCGWRLWGSLHLRIFHHNSSVMESSICSHLNSNEPIATKSCPCQDSGAVMACVKFCIVTRNGITVKQVSTNLYLWRKKKIVVKWVYDIIWRVNNGAENHICVSLSPYHRNSIDREWLRFKLFKQARSLHLRHLNAVFAYLPCQSSSSPPTYHVTECHPNLGVNSAGSSLQLRISHWR